MQKEATWDVHRIKLPPKTVQQQRVQKEATWDVHRIKLPPSPSSKNKTPTKVRRLLLSPTKVRSTRSAPSALFPIGTIIRRKCDNDNIFYKGEVTAYDTINDLYENGIRYKEGEIDDFTYDELRK